MNARICTHLAHRFFAVASLALLLAASRPARADQRPSSPRRSADSSVPPPILRPLVKGFQPREWLHPYLRDAIAAEERLDFDSAMRFFVMATDLGVCRPGTRCYWHYLMARVAESVWHGRGTLVRSSKEAETVATALANAALAIRVDRGRVAPLLERTAWRYYQLAALADPSNPSPLVGLAALRAEQGVRAEALALLARALRKHLRRPLDWYNVGYVYAALRIRDRALFYLKRSIESGCSNCREWARLSDDFRHYKNDPEFRLLIGPMP